jgi:hypothetical protein
VEDPAPRLIKACKCANPFRDDEDYDDDYYDDFDND